MPQDKWVPISPQTEDKWTPIQPQQPEYQDQPSIIGGWLNAFNAWDQPLLRGAGTQMGETAAQQIKQQPSWVSGLGLAGLKAVDPLGLSGLAREYSKPAEDRSVWGFAKSMIPGLDTYLDITSQQDPREAMSNVAKGGGWATEELSRPSNLADLALTGGAAGAARFGAKTIGIPAAESAAKWMTRGSRAIAAPIAAGGLQAIGNEIGSDDPSGKNIAMGGLQAVLGTLGVMQPRPNVHIPNTHNVELPPGFGRLAADAPYDVPRPDPFLPGMEKVDWGQGTHHIPDPFFDKVPEEPLGPFQGSLPFEKTVPSPFEYEGTPRPTPFQPRRELTLEETMRGVDPTTPPPPTAPPPAEPPGGGGTRITGEEGLDVVSITKFEAGELELLRQQGYIPWEGHRDARGRPQWIRPNREAPVGDTTATPTPTARGAQLPRDLQGGRPRYQHYELEFDNDLDKSLYIIAQETPSKRDSDYLRYVMHTLGVDEAGARELGGEVRKAIGQQVSGQPAGVVRLEQMMSPTGEAAKTVSVGSEPFAVPTARVSKAFIENMRAEGIKYVGKDEKGNSFFQRTDEDISQPLPSRDPRMLGSRVEDFEAAQDWEPQAAQLPSGKAVFTTDVRNNIAELTKGYSKPLPFVMVREGVQNFLDAIEGMGDLAKGTVKIKNKSSYNNAPGYIEITDNGKGMTRDELFSLFTTMHKSGKVGQAGATGGKGVGKATYVFGGDHFELVTVARTPDGKKISSRFEGNPEDFLPQGYDAQGNPIGGFDIITEEVPANTPTGTRIKTILKDEHSAYDAHESIENIVKYSRNKEGSLEYDTPWKSNATQLKGNPNDTLMAKDVPIDGKNNTADFYVPEDAKLDTRSYINVQYLNNGMWQFEKLFHIGPETHGLPDTIVVDLKPKVPELSENYPFPVQRESLLDKVQTDIENAIKDNILSPMGDKKKRDLAALWNQMQATPPTSRTARESVFFDSGARLTPEEAEFMKNSPVIQGLQRQFDSMFDELLTRWGHQSAIDRVVRTGIFMGDPGYMGWHIPDPLDPKNRSMIIVSPFEHILRSKTPKDAAWGMVGTGKHEVAHAGTHDPARIELVFDPADLADPRLGKDFVQYMNEVNQQGGLDYGHGMPFIRRLGEVYANTGARTAFYHADLIESILTGGRKSGSYSPEVQELLRIYKESRGRAATQEDILSGTGIKQRDPRSGGAGNIPSDGQAIGEGITAGGIGEALPSRAAPNRMEELKAQVRSAGVPRGPTSKEPSVGRQAYDFARGVTTTGDLSAPLRQGLPLIFTKSWWTSWNQMLKSFGSEEAFKKTLSDLRNRKIFQREVDVNTGRARPSFAERSGLELMDLNRKLGKNEEAVVSSWVETGQFLGKDNKFQRAYQKYPGRYARASNRAYTAFLNQLRADTFESLIKDASRAFDADVKSGTIAKTGAKNPMTDLVFAREIADFVNTATGRGPLKIQAPGFALNKIGGTNIKVPILEYNLERHAPFFTGAFFSPRLIASRMRMLNPATYMMASPFVRKQYIKAAVSTAAAWTAVATVAQGTGAEVSLDPTSADFGKMKWGNTRLDPGAGFQQYLAAFARLTSGQYTSSSSGETTELGEGFRADTKGDVAHRFIANKLHPVLKFAHDIAYASERTPFQVGDRTLQMFIPLIVQDLIELAKEDPSLLPLLGPIGAGMGSQTYEKGEAVSKFFSPENEPIGTLTGGESIYPWQWGQ